jgi:Fe-S-cluster containining protein
MFHLVELQPADSPSALKTLGFHLKRKHRQDYFKQPCPAHGPGGCSIYTQRPERCRVFDCLTLDRVATGEYTEDFALEKILQARALATRLESLLESLGDTNTKRPLTKRFEKVNAEPLHDGLSSEVRARRIELAGVMHEFQTLLDAHFRRRKLYTSLTDFNLPEALIQAFAGTIPEPGME